VDRPFRPSASDTVCASLEFDPVQQRRPIEPPQPVPAPACRQLRKDSARLGCIRHRTEHTRAGAGESGLRKRRQPVERLRDRRIAAAHHRFAVIMATGPEETANCDDRRILVNSGA
jgi:hypothetical protein